MGQALTATTTELVLGQLDGMLANEKVYGTGPKLDRERELMLAIMTLSIDDYAKGAGRTRCQRSQWQEARDWFLSDRADHIYSFVSICEFLKFDPSAMRKAVLGPGVASDLYQWRRSKGICKTHNKHTGKYAGFGG